jgi:hypothetical protein
MATRKNLKKTGKRVKPRRGGAKKRKTVKKGGMWPFTTVHPTDSFDIPTPDVFFSNYIPQYKQMYKQLPQLRQRIETYILKFPRKEFIKKIDFLFDKKIISASAPDTIDIQIKHVVKYEDQYPEGKPFGFEDRFDQLRAIKSNEEYQRNLNIAGVGVIDPKSKEMSKILGNQYNKNPKDVAREKVFGTEGITDLIESFGVKRTPNMLFDFLATIKGKEITDLSQEEKKN